MQPPKRLPLIVGTVLVVAAVARHRHGAHAWPHLAHDGALAAHGRPRLRGHRRHVVERLADCAERMAAAHEVQYV